MKTVVALLLVLGSFTQAAEVQWTRLRGTVKSVNHKASTVTLENREGDLLTVKVDGDVLVISGKDEVPLSNVKIDDKITLVYVPRPEAPKEEEPAPGSVYPPAKSRY